MYTQIVKIIGKDKIDDFSKKHSLARKPLAQWVKKVEQAQWKNSSDVKATFPTVDHPDDYIFNIAGNKYRLVAIVEIINELVIVLKITTHAEYSKWNK